MRLEVRVSPPLSRQPAATDGRQVRARANRDGIRAQRALDHPGAEVASTTRRGCLGSEELCGGADRWSAAKACVELVIERVQPTAARAANRHPPHNLANC